MKAKYTLSQLTALLEKGGMAAILALAKAEKEADGFERQMQAVADIAQKHAKPEATHENDAG